MSPTPVVAGTSFTLTLAATNVTYKINDVRLSLTGPSGAELLSGSCRRWAEPFHFEPAFEVHLSIPCEVPAGAPNGTWNLHVSVRNEGYSNNDVDVPFEVTGGSTDVASPHVSLSIPSSVVRGSSFDIGIRAVDEHGPVQLPVDPVVFMIDRSIGGGDQFSCRPGAWTTVDATTFDYAATCDVPADQRAGSYDTVGWNVFDPFGQGTPLDFVIDVV